MTIDTNTGSTNASCKTFVSFTSTLFWRLLSCSYLLLFVSGCASYGEIENRFVTDQPSAQKYSLIEHYKSRDISEIAFTVYFSGGGTRAAAMAYGVMQELRDTNVMLKNGPVRLLDEIDIINSVSGGSFTAAYYGLHGDGLFETFEEAFLRKNVEKDLIFPLFNPLHWFSSTGRTEMAVKYYQKYIFHEATYADMMKPGRPLIIINTSDLAYGVRFSFIQEYFDLLCSDLLSFPVASAVTASSAVPVAFNPIVVKNYSGCDTDDPDWLKKIRNHPDTAHTKELDALTEGLKSYSDKEQRKYIHFVDGGITDNTGLRAFYDILELFGGPKAFFEKTYMVPPNKWVVLSIDASTEPVSKMDETNRAPSIEQTMSAVTGIQLHRYNAASIDLVQTSLHTWANDISTPERPVTPYFIEVSFEDVKEPAMRKVFNMIPTSFFLENEQVDKLIEAGRELLRNNPEFQRLLTDIKKKGRKSS